MYSLSIYRDDDLIAYKLIESEEEAAAALVTPVVLRLTGQEGFRVVQSRL
jgi:hypothetical protein